MCEECGVYILLFFIACGISMMMMKTACSFYYEDRYGGWWMERCFR